MTPARYILCSALALGAGCSPSLGTITSEGQSSSTSATAATAMNTGGAASTEAGPTTAGPEEPSTSTTSVEPGAAASSAGDPAASTGAAGTTSGMSESTTGAGDSTTGEMPGPLYPACPVCTDSFQACQDDDACAGILGAGCVEGDLECIALAISAHCEGADLFFALDVCVQDNCGQPVCIAQAQACAAAPGCTKLRVCVDDCGDCGGGGEACRANCKGQASMTDVGLYSAWIGCILTPQPVRAGLSSDRDYNGDGRDDVFWYSPGTDGERLWLGTGVKNNFSEPAAFNIDPSYSAVAGDFNGDGFADVFLHAPGLPDLILNGSKGGVFTVATPQDQTGDYIPIAGDFDGDGKDDLFWYAPGPAADFVWYALGNHQFSKVVFPVGGDYLPVSGDFDGDGRDDILWYVADGMNESVWYGNDPALPFEKKTFGHSVSAGHLPFSGNFDADGACPKCDDIFWYTDEKADSVWNGSSDRSIIFVKSGPPLLINAAKDVLGDYYAVPGDFNGDKHTDIIWYGRGDDIDYIWYGLGNNDFDDKFSFMMGGAYKPI